MCVSSTPFFSPHCNAGALLGHVLLSPRHPALSYGVDDIDGTVVWYDITKVDGANTHQEVGVGDLRYAVREAGFEPVERDTLYRRVERNGADWRVVEAEAVSL